MSTFELAALTHVGTERPHNEDHCALHRDGPGCALLAVADGVSGQEGGEVASQTAVEAVLRTWREQPAGTPAAKKLSRAVQQANIEVYDKAIIVPELRGMATTLTAIAIDEGEMTAAHVGDCRLYLLRGDEITQLTKDHTVVGERIRYRLMSEERARVHPDRSTLTRSLGRELIVAIDRLSTRAQQDDTFVLCTDGLYNVLADDEIRQLARGRDAESACRALIGAANERGTADNLTAGVIRVTGAITAGESPGIAARLRRLVGRG